VFSRDAMFAMALAVLLVVNVLAGNIRPASSRS
jgi:hypothetical protein